MKDTDLNYQNRTLVNEKCGANGPCDPLLQDLLAMDSGKEFVLLPERCPHCRVRVEDHLEGGMPYIGNEPTEDDNVHPSLFGGAR